MRPKLVDVLTGASYTFPYTVKWIMLGCLFLLFGCRPDAEKVAQVALTIPLGSTVAETHAILLKAYEEKIPHARNSIELMSDLRPVTNELIRLDKECMLIRYREGCYAKIYPKNLLERLSSSDRFAMIGMVSETAHGNGSVRLFFDKKGHYMGFFADSIKKSKML